MKSITGVELQAGKNSYSTLKIHHQKPDYVNISKDVVFSLLEIGMVLNKKLIAAEDTTGKDIIEYINNTLTLTTEDEQKVQRTIDYYHFKELHPKDMPLGGAGAASEDDLGD